MARPVEGEIRLPAGHRLVDAADIDARRTVAGHREIVERDIILGIGRRIVAGDHLRVAGRAENPDRLHFRQRALDLPQPHVQTFFVGPDIGVRKTRQHVLDGIERQIHRMEDFERLLLQHVERAFDSFVGQCVGGAIAQGAGECEKQQRQEQRGGGQDLQQTNGGGARLGVLRMSVRHALRRCDFGHGRMLLRPSYGLPIDDFQRCQERQHNRFIDTCLLT